MKHTPRKRFGQNFLVARDVIAAIVHAIQPAHDDHLVEIGPGLGALTQPLCAKLDHLTAIEIDRDLIANLNTRFGDQLTVHQADALEFDFSSLGNHLRLVGNLPYNISTPLLFHLLSTASTLRDMHFMLQKEVVMRIAATPSTSNYGRLSVMLQYRCHVEQLFVVPATAFKPEPKVDSAFVRLLPRRAEELAARDMATFTTVVQQAFSQRRKMLRNTLKPLFSAQKLDEHGVDPLARAEDLTVADYVRLANSLSAFIPL